MGKTGDPMKLSPILLASIAPILCVGCVFSLGKAPAPISAAPKTKTGLFGRTVAWLKEDPHAESTTQSPAKANNSAPQPQKYPVGSVHLVQTDRKFVLIRTGSRLMEVSPDGELMTYDQAGRPTGKLKLSPERKSGFLAADIVEGAPKTGDRVVWFGNLNGNGSRSSDPFRDSPGTEPVEVLE
jgi:hypothetical protein